jgi:hypothetical protein
MNSTELHRKTLAEKNDMRVMTDIFLPGKMQCTSWSPAAYPILV